MFPRVNCTCEGKYYKITNMRDTSTPELKFAVKIFHFHSFLDFLIFSSSVVI